jgi:hypothetical protein
MAEKKIQASKTMETKTGTRPVKQKKSVHLLALGRYFSLVGTALTHNSTTITTQLLLLTGPFAIFLGKSEFHRACAFRNFVQIESADPFPFSFAVLTGSVVVSLVPSLGSDGGCEEQ